MARTSTISVSLTSAQMRLLRRQVDAGQFESPSDAVREGLALLFDRRKGAPRKGRPLNQELAAGYRASAKHDRRTNNEWDQLNDAWPEN